MGKKAGGEAGAGKALGWAGVGMDVVSLGMSLAQSGEQAAAQREAQRQAEIATKMQIQQQEQNFFEAMQVPTEAYDRALREGTAQQSQALMSLQEGDPRQLLGGVGKVQAAANDYNAQNRDAMAQQMFDLQKLQAQEKMLNADDLAKIYGERAEGAQKAAAAAENAKFGLLNNAFRAGKDALLGADKMRKEYSKGKSTGGQGGQGGQGPMPSYSPSFYTNGLGSVAPAVSTPDSYKNEINIIPAWERPAGGGKPYSINAWANPNPLFQLDMYGNLTKS